MLLIDGVKYEAWTPTNEDEFERMVKEHAKDIFGEQSIYLDIKHKLRTKSGIGSIPDGYLIILGDEPHWHIVEVELSSHPLYEHIVPQVGRFIGGIRNPSTQKEIVDALFHEIDSDEFLRLRLRKAIGATETYKFLADLASKSPVVTIIIERRTEQLDEAVESLAHSQIKVVQLETFAREDVGLSVHAHLFEPLYEGGKPSTVQIRPDAKVEIPSTHRDKRRFRGKWEKGGDVRSSRELLEMAAATGSKDAAGYLAKGKAKPYLAMWAVYVDILQRRGILVGWRRME
jgi:predicted small metal-binding protein